MGTPGDRHEETVTDRPPQTLPSSVDGTPERSAIWMIARGGVTAAASLGIPFLLSNILARQTMNAWILMVFLTSWIRLLDLGITTAVVRFVARESAPETKNQVVRAGSQILRVPAILATVALATLAALLTRAYPSVARIPGARSGLMIMALFASITLLIAPANGFYVAQHRGRFLAIALAGSRGLQVVATLTVAIVTKNLFWIAAVFSLTELLGSLFVWTRFKQDCPTDSAPISESLRLELRRHCASSAVWAVSGIFVASLDTAIVARVEAVATSEYGLCLALTATVGGLHAALLSPLIAQVASTTNDSGSTRTLVMKAARKTNRIMALATTLLLLCTPIVILAAGKGIDRSRMATVLAILHLANFLRFLGAPYASALLGTGEHRRVVASPVLEAVANLSASLVLGHFYGAIGVATGTLIGALASLLLHLAHNMRRTVIIAIDPRRYIADTIFVNLSFVLVASGATILLANR